MAKTEEKAVEGAKASPATSLFAERMKVATTIDADRLAGIFRGSKLVAATEKDFNKLSIGVPNSGVKKDEYFRVIKPLIIDQPIQGEMRRMPVLIIENTKGEQRPIYASGLLRSTPTRSTDVNQYDQNVIDFNRGLLQGTVGLSFPQLFDKLVGNGSEYVHVTDVVNFEVKGTTTAGVDFTANQSAYALELVDEATAKSAE